VLRRVVITGIGLITPLGLNLEDVWQAAVAGRSGTRRIDVFDASGLPSQVAGLVQGFQAQEIFGERQAKKLDRFLQFAVVAARQAFTDSKLEKTDGDPRAGVVIGAGIGGLHTLEEQHLAMAEKGYRGIKTYFVPSMLSNLAAGMVSIEFGLRGPNLSTSTACAASNHAVGLAFHMLRANQADVMVCGGSEAAVTALSVAGFSKLRALSKRNDLPEKASRPFDRDRDGFVIAEGAGVLVLEELEHAQKRGASIYAEVSGFGMSSDAFHVTAPSPDGQGAALAMENALTDAGITAAQVNYINAHGTSTPLNDVVETRAIKLVFGKNTKVPISSNKSMMGHMLGAAGGVETALTAMSIANGYILPTINLEQPDPECDLDYTAGQGRQQAIDYAINNSFGFGGTNTCLVLKRYDGE